jgi:hypothetical protein
VAVVLPAAAVSVWLLVSVSGGSEEAPGPPKAAIVDQLSLTAPNPDFGEQAGEMLERAGYQVDYFPGEVVRVDFYRDLPTHGYEIILLRAHAAGQDFGEDAYGEDVSLFTSERVGPGKYVKEQRERLLKGVGYTARDMEEGNLFFGIPPAYVESKMRGNFDGATVVLMGCDVLRAQNMAEAFVGRGAGAVVGWDRTVSASHTDVATLSMLRQMLEDDLSPQEAAAAAMAEVGPDPYYESVFLSYPPEG